ncbi:alpha/beta hydrolase [Haloechinothrix halophila]|uniref:alpha/beta hydrolase n=1 Tax=Haloechinothrix halophila TaxID=1069073 RepID=UPI0004091F7F|nr:alpha/beta fold hydrolase [Haloechinothrix halophila]
MRIHSGDTALAADLVTPAEPSGAGLLFVHGYGSDRRRQTLRATEVSQRLGHTGLAVDLSGHGDSPGDLRQCTRQDHLRDVVAAYDALAAAEDVERIGVCAASYGAYLSCLLLGERPIERLLLRAPALYIDAEGPDPESRQHLRALIDTNAALANLAAFDGDTLVLESEHDEVISQRSIEAYLHAARHGTHRVLAGARHALTDDASNAAFLAEIIDWFTGL